ncbi:MAG: DUF4173 domain-containing protein [Anaerolineae bacterium]|nr:DUF4173 domain-containing protein [Anaerolineae bacterium]
MEQQVKNSVLVLGIGLALGVLGMLLTFIGTIGLGMALFFLVWVGVVLLHARWQGITPQKRPLLLLVPLIFSALMLALRADFGLGLLNIATFLASGLLLIFFFSGGNLLASSLLRYGLVILESGVEVAFRPFDEALGSLKWITERRGQWQKLMPVVRGLAITAPIVVVFLVLFGSADAIFAKYLHDFTTLFNINDINGMALRVGYAGVIGWLAVGTLSASLVDHSEKRKRPPSPQAETDIPDQADAAPDVAVNAPLFRLGLIEASMVLGGVGSVFLLFVLVQGVYLFGGAHNIANFSYAEYTHRGFAELVTIAVLSLGLIYVLKSVTSPTETHQNKLFRGLGTLLLLLTGVVLMSAFQRLRLYEITYGFTSLRLTIYIAIGWLGVLLVGMIASLYWSPRTVKVFETSVLIAAFGFSITHSLINPDWFVAWQNINRGDIDPVYLSLLSEEATPALLSLIDSPDPGVRVIMANRLRDLQTMLARRATDWRSMTLRDYALRVQLDDRELNDKIETILSEDAPHLLDDTRLDTALKLGMTVREVTRQFGAPLYSYAGADRGDDVTTVYNLYYSLPDGNNLSLDFDTVRGLTTADRCNNSGKCVSIK